MTEPVVVNPGGAPISGPVNVYPNGYQNGSQNGYPNAANGSLGDASGVAQLVMNRLDQLGQPPAGQQRKVWPWVMLAIGGTIAGALTGYILGGFFCKVGRVVRGG